MKINCQNCNKEINRKPSYIKRVKTICCSVKCMSEYAIKNNVNNKEVICEQCKKKYIKTIAPSNTTKQNFCTQQCFKDYTKENKTNWKPSGRTYFVCDNCGKETSKPNNKYENHKNHFCNNDCMKEWKKSNPKWSYSYKEGCIKIFNCEECGKEFKTYESQRVREHRFCSKECSYKYNSGTNAHNYNKIEYACDDCGKLFKKFKEYFTYSKRNKYYCSRECYYKNNKGENSALWKGGISEIHNAIRESQLNRNWKIDIFILKGTNCTICNSKKDVHIHHLKPFHTILEENNIHLVNQIDNCDELWSLDNGEPLCKKCHFEFHNIYGRTRCTMDDYYLWKNNKLNNVN